METVDNLDRALSTVPAELAEQVFPSLEKDSNDESSSNDENKALLNLYQGLKMTEIIMMETLKKHGLERFDPSEDGAMFDPRLHEATFQAKAEGKEDGELVMVQQKGFILNGRVLRVRSSPLFLVHHFVQRSIERKSTSSAVLSLSLLLRIMGKFADTAENPQAAKVGVVKN